MNLLGHNEDIPTNEGQPLTRRHFLGAVIGGAAAASTHQVQKLFADEKKTNGNTKESPRVFESTKEVIDHINDGRVETHKAIEILTEQRFECVDGRCTDCIAGVPGGDIGHLFRQLTAVEKVTGRLFTEEEAKTIFRKVIAKRKKKFYMHIDSHVVEHLAEKFSTSQKDIRKYLKGKAKWPKNFLEELLETDNIGCGHLKLLLTQAKEYPGARPELLRALIRAFYEELQEGGNVELVILEGEHLEGAVSVVQSKKPLTDESEVPLFKPNNGKTESFVLHSALERLADEHFVEEAAELTGRPLDPKALLDACGELQVKYTEATGTLLSSAKDLPYFAVDQEKKNAPVDVEPIQKKG